MYTGRACGLKDTALRWDRPFLPGLGQRKHKPTILPMSKLQFPEPPAPPSAFLK